MYVHVYTYVFASTYACRSFGYEVPDTLLVATQTCVMVLTSAKKAQILEPVRDAFKAECGIELKLQIKSKSKDPKPDVRVFVDSVKAEGVKKIGVLAREKAEGPLSEAWEATVQSAGIESVNVTDGLSRVLAVKDDAEVTNVKKAAYMSAMVMQKSVVEKLESVMDNDQRVKHSKLMDKTASDIANPAALKIKLRPENLQEAYDPIFQSGGAFDLRPTAQTDDAVLDFTCMVVALGVRYASYCSNIARTYMMDPPQEQADAYKAVFAAHELAVSEMQPGVKLADLYETVRAKLEKEKPGLGAYVTKNIGFGMGLELRESMYIVSPKSTSTVRAGMVFNVAVGIQGVPYVDVKDNGSSKKKKKRGDTFSLFIADTVLVTEPHLPNEVLTKAALKGFDDVAYFVKDDDEEDEENDENVNGNGADAQNGTGKIGDPVELVDGPRRAPRTERDIEMDNAREAERRRVQESLEQKKNEETLRRLTEQRAGASESRGLLARDPVSFPGGVSEMRSAGSNAGIYVDMESESVVLPIYGQHVPFHVSTVKNVTSTNEGSYAFLRITFNVPGSAQGAISQSIVSRHPKEIFVKDLAFRCSDIGAANTTVQHLRQLRRVVTQRESEEAERSTLVKQEKLRPMQSGRPIRLMDTWIRPAIGGRGKKLSGALECHENGFRYKHPREQAPIDVMFRNIKHAIFQPAEKELTTIVHFNLHDPIMVGKKKTSDVQFYTEVMEAVTDLAAGRRSAYDPDEIEEEQRERERRNRINSEFQGFVKKVQEHFEKNHRNLSLEFDIPFKDLGFDGVPFKETAYVVPAVNCLCELVSWPPLVISLSDIEIVNFERVGFGLKNFDMTIVFKDFSRGVHRIDAIPIDKLETIKEWLNSIKIKYYESKMNLVWKPILKTIIEDPQDFVDNGGWNFLDMEGDDDDDDDDRPRVMTSGRTQMRKTTMMTTATLLTKTMMRALLTPTKMSRMMMMRRRARAKTGKRWKNGREGRIGRRICGAVMRRTGGKNRMESGDDE